MPLLSGNLQSKREIVLVFIAKTMNNIRLQKRDGRLGKSKWAAEVGKILVDLGRIKFAHSCNKYIFRY